MKRLAAALSAILLLALCVSPVYADKLEDIKKKGVLVAGVKDSQPPFGYVDENSKEIVGFEIDLMKLLATKLGVKLEVKPVTSSTRIPMLTQGDIDIVAATMTHSRERDKTIDFSVTYFLSQQKLLVKKDSGITSIKQLAGKKIGSAKGSTSEQNAKRAQPEATILSFETYPEAFLALKQGKVDAVTTDDAILLGLRNEDDKPGDYILVGDPISAEPYGLGMAQNDSKFRNAVNSALMDMWTSGDYQKIYDKWFGKDTKFYIPLTFSMELWP
jgi:polar amino acid transport system substrate-binding protein